MIAMERNADLIKMASYAPLLEHFDLAEWSPDLIGFDSISGVTRSVSYFIQQMFASNRADQIVPVKAVGNFGPVYWVAGTKSGKQVFVKMANYGSSAQTVTVNVNGKATATATSLSGQPTQSNLPGNEAVKSKTSTIQSSGNGNFKVTMPAWSVVVLNLA